MNIRTATLVLIIAARLLVGAPVAQASTPCQETNTVVTVRPGDTLSSIAARYGTTYQAIMRANNLSDTLIVPGQRLAIPQGDGTAAVETLPTPVDQGDVEAAYVVRAGDSLWSVAVRYGISVAELKQANGIVGSTIVTGQVLRIPAPQSAQAADLDEALPLSPCGATYTVRRGDTLSAIARACGTTVSALAASNDLVDGNVIRVGQVLHVGGAAETEADTPYTLWIPIPSIGLDLILPAGLLDRY